MSLENQEKNGDLISKPNKCSTLVDFQEDFYLEKEYDKKIRKRNKKVVRIFNL